MRIYKYIPDSDIFDGILRKREYSSFRKLFGKGKPVVITDSIMFEFIGEGEKGDFPSFYAYIPALSKHAWDILSPYLSDSVEPIIIKVDKEDYVVLNVLNIIDCLNKDKSVLSINHVANTVSSIKKYFFNLEDHRLLYMFTVPEVSNLEIYVTEEFKTIVEKNNLKGLYFDEMVFEINEI